MEQDKCVNNCGFFKSNSSKDNNCLICEKKQYINETNCINEDKYVNNKKDQHINKKPKHEKQIQKNKNKCWECKKKIGLLGIQCRCKYYFCSKHRYAEEHNCIVDYKTLNKTLLKTQLTKCNFKKIEKL